MSLDPTRLTARIERDAGHWRNTTIAMEAWRAAREHPERVALYLEHEPNATYAALADEALRLIAAFRWLGLAPGDVIAFQLPNWREVAAIDIAAAALGLVTTPIVPIYRDTELDFILKDSGAKLLFIPGQFRSIDYPEMVSRLRHDLPSLEHVVTLRDSRAIPGTLDYQQLIEGEPCAIEDLPRVDPNAVKCRLYTSGTTGYPKAVLHSHNTLSYVQGCSARHGEIGRGDVMLMPSPVTHVTGYSSGINLCFMSEMQTALMERWDADQAIDIINNVGITLTLGATPFLQELLAAAKRRGDRLPVLRQFSCGGAAVPPSLVREAQEWFENCVVARVYGSTEVPLVSYGWRDNPELAANSDGQLYAFDVRVLDDDGHDVASGADGEIAARGPGMFLGYADLEQTREAHTSEDFFLTGDIGHVTEEGAVVITDRKKDLIIRGGENLSAKEIENVLHRHPGLKEAAVVSMPHDRLGEGVCAFIIAAGAEAPSGDELKAFAESQSLARQKIPERFEFVDELPRTAAGKVRKDQLRKRLKWQ